MTLSFSRRDFSFASTSVLTLSAAVRAAEPAKSRLMTELGTISFPNSGNAAAQAPFLTGVKALHNFQFDEAAEAFRLAQAADPNFALAYWGEAMSYNHPLWAEQDIAAARVALGRLAPTPEARAAKTKGKEREWLAAVETLYGKGEKLARDIAYEQALAAMHRAYPDDDEVAVFHALSILGAVRPGDPGVARQMRAGAIALDVFARNPQHPGAAHFVIHSFDDPEHAILALPAARAYAGIAADAPHALHMPSHIFVQLGMWEGVIASNDVAFKAAVELAERKNLERGREDFHTLSWMQYGQIQLGRFDDAKAALETARAIERAHPTEKVRDGVLGMLARYVIDTERWDELPADAALSGAKDDEGGAHAAHRRDGNVDLSLAKGLAAVHRGDTAAAARAADALKAIHDATLAQPGGAYRAKVVAVAEFEVRAAIAEAANDAAAAEGFLKQATAVEGSMAAPSGPPQPLKPAFEAYGEFLLRAGRGPDAAKQFELALARTPNRTRSVQGLARSRPQAAEGR
jgi:tetratricopeptide (TPR) repeat protein